MFNQMTDYSVVLMYGFIRLVIIIGMFPRWESPRNFNSRKYYQVFNSRECKKKFICNCIFTSFILNKQGIRVWKQNVAAAGRCLDDIIATVKTAMLCFRSNQLCKRWDKKIFSALHLRNCPPSSKPWCCPWKQLAVWVPFSYTRLQLPGDLL